MWKMSITKHHINLNSFREHNSFTNVLFALIPRAGKNWYSLFITTADSQTAHINRTIKD